MKYTVTGTAFCPVTVSTEVDAPDEQTALRMANDRAKDWRQKTQFCAMDSEPSDWFDWQPMIQDVTANRQAD